MHKRKKKIFIFILLFFTSELFANENINFLSLRNNEVNLSLGKPEISFEQAMNNINNKYQTPTNNSISNKKLHVILFNHYFYIYWRYDMAIKTYWFNN